MVLRESQPPESFTPEKKSGSLIGRLRAAASRLLSGNVGENDAEFPVQEMDALPHAGQVTREDTEQAKEVEDEPEKNELDEKYDFVIDQEIQDRDHPFSQELLRQRTTVGELMTELTNQMRAVTPSVSENINVPEENEEEEAPLNDLTQIQALAKTFRHAVRIILRLREDIYPGGDIETEKQTWMDRGSNVILFLSLTSQVAQNYPEMDLVDIFNSYPDVLSSLRTEATSEMTPSALLSRLISDYRSELDEILDGVKIPEG